MPGLPGCILSLCVCPLCRLDITSSEFTRQDTTQSNVSKVYSARKRNSVFFERTVSKGTGKDGHQESIERAGKPPEGDTITLPSINIEEELWAVLRREAIAGRTSCILTTKDSVLMDYYICLLNRADIEHKAKDCRTVVISW